MCTCEHVAINAEFVVCLFVAETYICVQIVLKLEILGYPAFWSARWI